MDGWINRSLLIHRGNSGVEAAGKGDQILTKVLNESKIETINVNIAEII